MKMSKIETPLEYMESLNMSKCDLEKCKIFLIDWDKRGNDYYREHKVCKMTMKFDKDNREHLRNSIDYWEERLKNEDNKT